VKETITYIKSFFCLYNKWYFPVYIDESQFDISIQFNYAYSKRGTPAKHPTIRRGRTHRYSLIVASIASSVLGYMLFLNFVLTEDFNYFLLPLILRHSGLTENCFFVIDNDKVHRFNLLHQQLERDFTILFLPVRTPEYNQVKGVFSFIKNDICSKPPMLN
jgi:hypothetical protein